MKNLSVWRANVWLKFAESRLLLLLLLVVLAANATAQEKKKKPEKPQPPKTISLLPADSTKKKAQKPAPKSRARSAERLQLPDVMIYGNDTEKRIAGKKITISPDQPELVNPPSLYDPLQAEELEQGRRQDAQRPKTNLRSQQGKLIGYGGVYSQLNATAGWWQALTTLDYGAEAAYARTDGQYLNSQEENISVGLRLGIRPDASTYWRTLAQYDNAEFGLHGSALTGHQREIRTTAGRVTGRYRVAEGMTATFNGEFEKNDVKESADTSFAALLNVDNTYFSLSGELKRVFSNSELSLKARTLRDQKKTAIDDTASTSWHAINLAYDFPVNSKLSAQVSADFTAVSENKRRQSLLRPGLKIVFVPSQKLAASVSFSSGFEYLPWKSAVANNRYIASRTRPSAEKTKWRIAANIDWQITDGFVFKAKYESKRIDGYNYFTRDSQGTFVIKTADFKLGVASVGSKITISEYLQLDVSLHVFDDALQGFDGPFANLIDIPYRGEYRLPVKLTVTPFDALVLESSIAWISARRTALLPQPTAGDGTQQFAELPAYLFANIHATYQFAHFLEAFARVENLFDDRYESWQGYPEMGLNAVAGLRLNW